MKADVMNEDKIKDEIGKEYDRQYPLTRASLSDLDCYNAVAKAQAKISFPAGYNVGFDAGYEQKEKEMNLQTVALSGMLNDYMKLGRNGVVEWIKETFTKEITINQMMATNTWQTQLEDWGISEEPDS